MAFTVFGSARVNWYIYQLTELKPDCNLVVRVAFALILVGFVFVSSPLAIGSVSKDATLGVSVRAPVVGFLNETVVAAEQFLECVRNPWVSEGYRTRIDPMLLYSIALTESRMRWSDGWVRPCPYCVRVDGVMHKLGSKEDAQSLVRSAVARGQKITDMGVMQVNAAAHAKRVDYDLTRLVDVRTNIAVGAQILREALDSSSDLETGLGRYHSWTPRFGKPYGDVALRRYQHLTTSIGDRTLWPHCREILEL